MCGISSSAARSSAISGQEDTTVDSLKAHKTLRFIFFVTFLLFVDTDRTRSLQGLKRFGARDAILNTVRAILFCELGHSIYQLRMCRMHSGDA